MFKKKKQLILQLLREGEKLNEGKEWTNEMYGLELVEASNGKLKRGTIYVYLAELENEGLLTSWMNPAFSLGHRGRRMYRLTDAGRKEIDGE